MYKFYIVDDEKLAISSLKRLLSQSFDAEIFHNTNPETALSEVKREAFDIIFLDLHMDKIDGRSFLRKIKESRPDSVVIMVTGEIDVTTAITCMREGARDYLTKPIDSDRLIKSVQSALHVTRIENLLPNIRQFLLEDFVNTPEDFQHIITEDKRLLTTFKYIEAIAPTLNPILIVGETGTGKEMLAEAIHKASKVHGSLIPVDVSGLDDTMFSDTLFGHKKGAYTGADKERSGLIERASGGTLFLDEIGDLQEISQIKLLRLLQTSQYYQLGSDTPKKCNARIIAAVNKPLNQLLKSGFREDLFYRLSAHQVHLPPLRERIDDIPLLIQYFYDHAIQSYNLTAEDISPESIAIIRQQPFHGNIRELKALIEDLALRQLTGITFNQAVYERLKPVGNLTETPKTLQSLFGKIPTLKTLTYIVMTEAMEYTRHNQGQAAEILGLSRQAFNRRWNLMLKEKSSR